MKSSLELLLLLFTYSNTLFDDITFLLTIKLFYKRLRIIFLIVLSFCLFLYPMYISAHRRISCRTVALRRFSATHSKNCIFIAQKKLRRVSTSFYFYFVREKIPDVKNTRHVYLLGKNINNCLVHFY